MKVCESPIGNLEKGEMKLNEPEKGEMKLNEPEKGEIKEKDPEVGEESKIEKLSDPQKGKKEARIASKKKEAEEKIHLIEDLELKENCVTVTEIKVPRKFKENEQIVLHCSEHKGFVVANAVTKVKNGSIMINVLNLNDHALKLKQGTQLCSANRWSEQEVNGVSVEENKPQAVNKKDTYRPLTAEDINCGEKKMQEKLLKLLNKFRNICWIKGESLGKYTGDSLEIKLKEDVVVNKAPYRIPHAQQKQVDVEIKKMLDEGIISRSKSVFNSPMIIVPKPESSGLRLCLDMRGVNEVTVPIRFPIPRIADLLNSLNETKIISSIDLAAAYHQCEIKPEDRHKTAFTVNSSKYEYNRVAFGLTSAPGYFCRIINETLHEILGSNVVVYMDDILVFSKDEETHLKRIEEVLKRLAEVNLKIKVTKCQFFTKEVKFLGFTISEEGMRMDEGRIESLKQMPYPENKKQLQAFLGACNYFRLFVKGFAEIADPLYELLRKDARFNWTEKQKVAVDTLKRKLCSSPILKYPDFNKEFHIYTDASLVGISACLMQEHKGVLHPLSYVSKCLSETQRRYSTAFATTKPLCSEQCSTMFSFSLNFLGTFISVTVTQISFNSRSSIRWIFSSASLSLMAILASFFTLLWLTQLFYFAFFAYFWVFFFYFALFRLI